MVSIIIPIYNSDKYLYKCIKPILRQTYKNFELILINDGSTDNSLNICNKYASQERIRKVQSNNKLGGRYEYKIKKSSTYFIINADDMLNLRI